MGFMAKGEREDIPEWERGTISGFVHAEVEGDADGGDDQHQPQQDDQPPVQGSVAQTHEFISDPPALDASQPEQDGSGHRAVSPLFAKEPGDEGGHQQGGKGQIEGMCVHEHHRMT